MGGDEAKMYGGGCNMKQNCSFLWEWMKQKCMGEDAKK